MSGDGRRAGGEAGAGDGRAACSQQVEWVDSSLDAAGSLAGALESGARAVGRGVHSGVSGLVAWMDQEVDVSDWENSRVVQAASATASAVLAAAGLAEGGGARGRPPPPAAAGADAEFARVASPAAEPATRAADPAGQGAPPRGRFAPGDPVHVWSNSQQRWIEDGFVREVSVEDQEAHGCLIPEGSVRVVFGGDTSSKWVLAAQLDQFLRKAPDAAARVPSTATLAATSHHLPPAAKWPAPVPAAAAEGSPQGPPAAEAPISPARPESVLAELRSVELSCKLAGESFVDHEFPALVCGRVTRWCRPREIGHHDGQPLDAKGWSPLRASKPGWKLFRGAPQADDVRQGELGDCWFLSSLAALAEFEEGRFVRALLPEQTELSPAGAYVVHLCLGGRWRSVLVDDRLPCIGGQGFYTQLAYCATGRLQLWASLIEKGFAKACGSYEAVRGGQANQALSVLTGWPCTTINFDRDGFDPEVLWATLCSSKAAGFLMTCSTGSGEAQGMVPNHVHSLMDVADARDTNGRLVHLLKIRNPHGKTKWRGPWSPGSPEWTPELRRALGCSGDAGSGVFFMALDDFLHLFVQCTICRIHSEWCEVREELTLPGGSQVPCAALELEVFETTECAVSLVQLEERLRGGPLWQGDVEPLACIGFVLLSMGGADAPVAVAAANLRCRAAASAECWLKPGMTYLMVPLSLHHGASLRVTCACVSSRPCVLRARSLDRGAVRSAWAAYAVSAAERRKDDTFHGGTVDLGKGKGGAIVAFAQNQGRRYFSVELSIESDGLLYSRLQGVTKDTLAPGFGQILQVAQPARGSGGGASWRSHHSLESQFWSPGEPWHRPPLAAEALAAPAWLHEPFKLARTEPRPRRQKSPSAGVAAPSPLRGSRAESRRLG